ncbi:MAG: flagellar biosynthesis protein FlhA [Hydrogenobaculum sp.]
MQQSFVIVFFGIILAAILIPLPAFLLDILLAFAIGFSLVVLILVLNIKSPLELSSFPSILLIGTLLRLSLNIAAARRILLYGNEGPSAAGHIIEAFGRFVVGGNVVVGLIIFLIFIVINFVVITKGAERVSEVAARFTLDAMPGKQMSIDADLNAGLINEQEAKQRRKELEKEAAFYGAMDGASKFIRGDVMAAIIILFLSIIGGLVVGIVIKGMDFQEAVKNYTLLTVGEGLVSQMPALILSVSAGILTTKSSTKEEELSSAIYMQFTKDPKVLLFGAIALAVIGIMPGLPKIPFFIMAIILGGLYFYIQQNLKTQKTVEIQRALEQEKAQKMAPQAQREEDFLPQPDPITLEVGYGLIPFVDETQGGDLTSRIKTIRRQIAAEYGVIIPLVHIRDNMKLSPNQYRILIRGVEEDSYEVMPGFLLAIDLGNVKEKLTEGKPTKDPSFHLPAFWITQEQKAKATKLGYMVVDISTVIITHLSEVIKRNLYIIIGRAEIIDLVEKLSQKYQKVIKDIIPEKVSYSVLHRVVQSLLKENVPVNDMITIIETIGDYIDRVNDIELLVEFVRQKLSKHITKRFMKDNTLYVIAFSPRVETKLNSYIRENKEEEFLDLLINRLQRNIAENMKKFAEFQAPPVLITSPNIRRFVRKALEGYLPQLNIIAYNEIDKQVNMKVLGVVDEN